ncbi:rab GDP dissociation inhibitor [Thecamonas trahens ATCC 50062]|uniref:Rab GDP dissociation inhibitor n=1 Tax=Thecamonas trahens ATCC 50062 TaxID=461836 RepID=A0A0L0D680_THETB|nr:rab GDP dissociation inhibitor [Thecamonas trahens ATCC 50062]KNC47897.1 rab GDP dissociation inhibitor [Thecamonas trahens ATCC 50062]|eukprot:XP_013758919.1 rab GDP dissociation inhibitor [Thecamonas trahens ATCC 50062]
MDDKYDCIVLGTGLKECIISGLMSVERKKVLHMDRNDFYGGESASLTLDQLFQRFTDGQKPPESLGSSRDYQIDLIPKFIMANGALVNMLVFTGVNRYLEFKKVDGSFVMRGGKVYKVPATDVEALKSSLMGFFQKRKCKNFFAFAQNYDDADPSTHKGFNIDETPIKDIFEYYGLDDNTVEFIGHAVALNKDDSYLTRPARETFDRMKLYADSLARYGSSPYLYPLYGLGELPQGFARLSAIYGGTYMLQKPIEEVVYNDEGRVCGVKSEGEVAACDFVVGDPSYFPDKVRQTGSVVRCICILNHPIPSTDNAESCQIIVPQRQAGRNSDIYISCVSYAHNVAAPGKWIVLVSTTVETDNPLKELEPGFALLGEIEARFPSKDGVFITTSYDATTHFETSCDDVFKVYRAITGHDIDFDNPPRPDQDDE